MKTRLMAMMLMAGGALFAQTRLSIGVQIGSPAPVMVPAPAQVVAYQPPCPGPGYVWVDGYYDDSGNWYDGYWALPPYVGAYWVAPRFTSGQFYAGYWAGTRGVYRPAPRPIARPAYAHGPERGFNRPTPEAYNHGFRDRDNGHNRGPGHSGDFRQGFRR